mmetsp:Transcript_80369/g.145078  ORF Transcript_80369/g.145078 Transcript_80369/m.145078 type:complete len:209 (+) Transcript_80369:1219-1845(+)
MLSCSGCVSSAPAAACRPTWRRSISNLAGCKCLVSISATLISQSILANSTCLARHTSWTQRWRTARCRSLPTPNLCAIPKHAVLSVQACTGIGSASPSRSIMIDCTNKASASAELSASNSASAVDLATKLLCATEGRQHNALQGSHASRGGLPTHALSNIAGIVGVRISLNDPRPVIVDLKSRRKLPRCFARTEQAFSPSPCPGWWEH